MSALGCSGNGLPEPVETVHAKQVNIVFTAALQVLQYAQRKLKTVVAVEG